MLGPRSIESRPALQHQRSTKLLINRFESLSDHKLAVQATSPTKAPLCPPKQSVKKDKSPIRSIRNLFAVLKKGSGLRIGRSKLECLPDTTVSGDDPFTVSTKSFPGPQLAGSLFYLARSPKTPPTPPSVLPVWTFCSVVLEGETVHLTWPTTPSTHSILLKHCTDVRSLTSNQLLDPERALLPGDEKDLKVFEILFEGEGVGEKFATTSVRERARWVSAIWDVILPGANSASAPPEVLAAPDTDTSGHARPSAIFYSSSLDRALPPVPKQLNSPIAARSPSPRVPVSPRFYPPTGPDSRASSICSRSKSPSIANLDHLSVVKHRLAQIEKSEPPRSATISPTPLSRNSSVIRARSLRVQIPSHDEGPASPTSILESYGDARSAVGISSSLSHTEDEHVEPSRPDRQGTSSSHQIQKISLLPSSAAPDPLLTDIHQIISGVAQRTEETDNTVNTIQNKLDLSTKSNDGLMHAVGAIHERLRSDLPDIMKLLLEVRAGTERNEMLSKKSSAAASCDLDKLDQILETLKEDSLQRSMQAHQQTDSIRYLHELNSWLEAFVSGGTAQIQVVAAGVEKLCKELGCSDERSGSGGPGSIMAVIHQSITDGRARDQSTAALQLSVDNLAALMASESRNDFTTQSIASLIDQQRQDQEIMLRALTAELSNEIRGERLRFVDAMKEATAINVQMHVEQLKEELAREVRADLFAFYSKQRQPAAPPPRTMYAPQSRMAPPPRALSNPRYAAYP
ncbi:hypothetical protein C8R44DRAFT_989292 [Mycena epipterygia]|nr:hypothetical protein C8R44DRAFT_989292 [Mycena epipterygia]